MSYQGAFPRCVRVVHRPVHERMSPLGGGEVHDGLVGPRTKVRGRSSSNSEAVVERAHPFNVTAICLRFSSLSKIFITLAYFILYMAPLCCIVLFTYKNNHV